jgi:hypothetical protein
MEARNSEIRGVLLHLGRNLWGEESAADHLRCDDAVWRETTDLMATRGLNLLLVDVAEGVAYPSHPELAVKGSWSAGRLRDEVVRLRGMGIEAIPKLNFSTTHDIWLKDYQRMVSTPEYYGVCQDLIRDVYEIFGHPRFIHLGFDEENFELQKRYRHCVVRQGELWWHDLLMLVGMSERLGMRPWIWSDYAWFHRDEFMKRMPRSVLQSNWYYGREFDFKKLAEDPVHVKYHHDVYVRTFVDLEKAGFDQVPCGSNHYSEESVGRLADFCRANIAPERLKGFLVASWRELAPETSGKDSYVRNIRAVELAAKAFTTPLTAVGSQTCR